MATSHDQAGVVEAAYTALGRHPLELTQLRSLPQLARTGLKLPARYCATPAEAARRPEDVLPYVPGECWGRLAAAAPACRPLLTSLVTAEVAALPRAVYSLSQSMQSAGAEPVNYSHLPEQSVLRGVVARCQEAGAGRGEDTGWLRGGLGVLAADHGRPLPPLDWAWLEPLCGDAELRPAAVELLCRQAAASRTARLVVERQLRGEMTSEAAAAYSRHLPLLAAAVPPPVLGPWLARSLQAALAAGDLAPLLCGVRAALRAGAGGEAGLAVLGQALEQLHDRVPEEEQELYQVRVGEEPICYYKRNKHCSVRSVISFRCVTLNFKNH